jgi:glycosyltransferase involved in cell wall biosynthesis
MILFVHNRYRTTGGEERTVEDLLWLVREHLREDAEALTRDSGSMSRVGAAAGLLRGGLDPSEVAAAVRRTGARIVHAHNVNPAFGWRALAAARAAGARVVMHLHNYRLVCAVGTCFTRGADCTRCHGRNTAPGVRLNCRGTGTEAVVYGAGLALWQRRIAACVGAYVVPSAFALGRLRELGAPLLAPVSVVSPPVREVAAGSQAQAHGFALVAGRLAPEKGVDLAIDACAAAGIDLVIAGAGRERRVLEARADRSAVRFVGAVDSGALAGLRRDAAVAVVPSRSAETFGLAAAEAMAAGLPVVATAAGALAELVPAEGLVPVGDASAMAQAVGRLRGDREAGERALAAVRERCAPEVAAAALREVYESVAASDPVGGTRAGLR